jgi:hypothetical protein
VVQVAFDVERLRLNLWHHVTSPFQLDRTPEGMRQFHWVAQNAAPAGTLAAAAGGM